MCLMLLFRVGMMGLGAFLDPIDLDGTKLIFFTKVAFVFCTHADVCLLRSNHLVMESRTHAEGARGSEQV